MQRNHTFSQVAARYLFHEVKERRQAFLAEHPHAKLISLSIGDTTEPISPYITTRMANSATALASHDSYMGYGPEQGLEPLRTAIAARFYKKNTISPDEIFVSDGAKCDIARLQLLFGQQATVAIQNPSYPAYLDTSILFRGKEKVRLVAATESNGFLPNYSDAHDADVLIVCSPNNPTGTCYTFDELTALVNYAKKEQKLILFDAAYCLYVQQGLPRSIYEIDGAREVAIEIGSFSKMAGFSGVRLGWTVVPKSLRYPTGEELHHDWTRIITTFFNGASLVAQQGGIAALEEEGFAAMQEQVAFYLENTRLLKNAFQACGYRTHGGEHAPYLWLQCQGLSSWDAFDMLLHRYQIVTTPGVGFGTEGEGYLRVSGFATRNTIHNVLSRLK